MCNRLALIFPVFLLPLVLGWGVARAADQPDAGGFRVVLTDGSLVNGAVSLVVSLDTPYGQIKIPSSSLVSVRLDAEQKWADIQLTDAQMKLRYNPASSELKATTSVGPLTIALANVIKIARASADVSTGTAPNAAAAPSVAPSRPSVTPPVAAYAPQQPVTAPPAPVYPYSYPYQYYAPATTYYSPYYYSPYYASGPYIGWPYVGIGIGVGPRFRGFGWGFGIRIR